MSKLEGCGSFSQLATKQKLVCVNQVLHQKTEPEGEREGDGHLGHGRDGHEC